MGFQLCSRACARWQVYSPPGFKIYGVPYVCGFAIFGAFFLIASLGPEAVWRFFIVLIIISFLYLVYGVHAAQSHDNDLDVARTCASPDPTRYHPLM